MSSHSFSYFVMLTGYLFLYNMIQWGGWVMIQFDLVSNQSLTPYSTNLLYIFQGLALMEIVHAVIRFVRASPATTAIQVLGRLQVLVVHFFILEARESPGVLPMVFAWALVEIVRYLYLALHVIGLNPHVILWLRYSLFYVLYPIGVYGEMRTLYDALPGIDREGLFSATLPNQWNWSFAFGGYLRVFLVAAYIPGLVNQYTYMMKQRREVLRKDKNKKSS